MPTRTPYINAQVARIGLAEARFSQHKSFFRNFWSHGPQNRCIWSKISRGNWFWRLKLSSPSKIQDKLRKKTDFRDPQKSIFWGFKNQFFVIFPGFWRELTILGVKINFLVKFCSRYTYSEVRATKNCEKTICAARTWPLRALSARAQISM